MKRDGSRIGIVFVAMLAILLVGLLSACGTPAESADKEAQEGADVPGDTADYHSPGEGYELKQVVILARHNIRAPLSSNGSALAEATPHEWIEWTTDPSGLTLRGGVLETTLGQYVRQWLEAEELIPHDWDPAEDQVRVYANSLQRTHATAQYFISGMLPTADVAVETHFALNEPDPVFIPYLTYMSESYNGAALEQIAQMGGEDGMSGIAAGLAENYELLEDVCDYKESEGYKSGELTDLNTTDTNVVLEQGEEPAMTGSLKTATQLADALVLQYYESDDEHAAFGKELSLEQWEQIAAIKDLYCDVLFTTPLVATNVAHPMLGLIGDELDAQGRTFSFLCGHDSDIACVLAALGVENYELPNAIEKKTPIGSMVVFERWEDKDGKAFGRVRMVYQSVDQLRNITLLTSDEEPESYELSFVGLKKNDEGLYTYDDLRARLQSAEDAYDKLPAEYGDEAELDEAA